MQHICTRRAVTAAASVPSSSTYMHPPVLPDSTRCVASLPGVCRVHAGSGGAALALLGIGKAGTRFALHMHQPLAV